MSFEVIVYVDSKRLQACPDGRFQEIANVNLGEPDVSVCVALDLRNASKNLRVETEDESLGDDRNPVAPSLRQSLDDGTGERVDDRLEAYPRRREFFPDQGQRCAGGLADAEGQVPCGPPHRNDKVPARRRLCVDHQVLDDFHAVVPRGLEAEGVDIRRQVEIVVDRLGDMDDLQPAGRRLLELHRRIGGVITADRNQTGNVEPQQGCNRILEMPRVFRGVCARDADVRAAAIVDTRDFLVRERRDVGSVAFHDPLEAIADSYDFDAFQDRANRGRGDDAVDPGRGTSADEDGEMLVWVHRQKLTRSLTFSARQRMESEVISAVVKP